MLGGTGLKVSVLGFGTMSFNSEKQAKELMKCARQIGVNFFDNAEAYGEPCGTADIFFGKALKELQQEDGALWRRSDLVITDKLYMGVSDGKAPNRPDRYFGVNELGLSRKHLIEGMKDCLKRLQLDYVDIIYAHRYDGLTPMLEIVQGFTDIIKKGYAFYWGTSMWPNYRLVEAYWIAKVHNLITPVVEQPVYNMFSRKYVELEYLPLYENPYQLATTIWSPLDAGVLTGKYNKGIPDDSRMGGDRLKAWFSNNLNQEKVQKIELLMPIAEELKTSMTNLAIAWCLKNPNVSCVLLGATKGEQVLENAGCLNTVRELKAETMQKIDDILKNKPQADWAISAPPQRSKPLKSSF